MRFLGFLFSAFTVMGCAVDEEVPCVGNGPLNSTCKVYEFANDVYQTRQDLEYDEKQRVTAVKTSNVKSGYNTQLLFYYNHNNLVAEVIVNEAGDYKYTKHYKYASDTLLKKILYVDYDLFDSTVINYEDQLPASVANYKGQGVMSSISYFYNTDNSIAEKVMFEAGLKKETIRFEYFTNNTVERKVFDDSNNLISRFIDIYNRDNNLVQTSTFTPDNRLNTKTIFNFSGDSLSGVNVIDSLGNRINELQYIRF